MILDIDAGNTRIKWRFVNADNRVVMHGASYSVIDIERAVPMIHSIDRARIASVRDQEKTQGIQQWVQRRWEIEAELATVKTEQAGVRNAYTDVQKMGVDRWLSILAAFNQSESRCCVINAGTALTVDLIEESGQHVGGYIVPGLQLQRRALVQNTSILLSEVTQWAREWSLDKPGTSTEDAVNHGIYAMVMSWLLSLPGLRNTVAVNGLYIAGGDSAIISEGLQAHGVAHSCEHDLVLKGLVWALP
ncbi:MAG: type III pantothenate kinase [Pseudomonadales bacterium]|nr:type III pantothenate kinase [Pseudomonadales bacterium]